MINILISTYNGEAYIIEQLDSILKQTDQRFHIYIRDDGSKDSTFSIIQKYILKKKESNRITLIQGENIGFCSSFIELLKMAKFGEYWAFCDQDDFWLPCKIQYAVEYLDEQNKDVPILYHSAFSFVNERLDVINDYIPHDQQYDFRKSITCSECYGFSSVINRKLRDLLIKADPRQMQSHDWFAAMIAAAFGIIEFDDRITALHRIHGKNNSPNSFLQKIPRGIKLFKEESFYTKNVREFNRVYGEQLEFENKTYIDLFLNKKDIKTRLTKFFYPKRWNESLEIELILRFLMIVGKI